MNAPLYKRSSNGKIESWQIFVDGDGFYTVSGQFTGKLTKSAITVCLPKNVGKKNETTAGQQAELEAKAKYDKKLKSGYVVDLSLVDSVVKMNPQLAHKWSEYGTKTKLPVISTPKLDGLRAVVTADKVLSKEGNPFVSVPHILRALQGYFLVYPKRTLDGELYNHQLKADFNKLVSLVKKSKPKAEDLEESEKIVQFHIFDYFGTDETCLERKQHLASYFSNFADSSIQIVPFAVCNTLEELDACYADYLQQGYEGQMINNPLTPYVHKRTRDLLKRKEWIDEEFEIVDIVEGKGEREGCAKLILLCGQETFESSLKGSVSYMKEIFDNRQSYIGKMATVRYQNRTPDRDVPRFGVCHSIRDYE